MIAEARIVFTIALIDWIVGIDCLEIAKLNFLGPDNFLSIFVDIRGSTQRISVDSRERKITFRQF